MIKFTSNLDWDFGIESVSIVTDSSQLTKRASCKDKLQFKKTPNQTDVHLIALGAYEGTGLNRNGDLFREHYCKKNVKTFEKADRALHRHHKNKKSDPKFGNIKAAAYNEEMRRIELIVGHDNDKCADILEQIEKNGHADYSMACKIPHDICTVCGHIAPNDESRCDHIPSQLGEITKEGVACAMDNIDPNWFEISFVKRGADRIGMSLKLASDSALRPMLPSDYLKLYTGFEIPLDETLISKKASSKRELVSKLAVMEKHVEAISHSKNPAGKDKFIKDHGDKLNAAPTLSDDTIDELRKFSPDKLLAALAKHGIVLRPEEFSKYIFGDRIKDENIEGMKSHLKSPFQDAKEDGGILNNEKYEPSGMDIIPAEIKKLISGLTEGHSIIGEPAHRRVIRITMIGSIPNHRNSDKEPSKEAFDKEMARQYTAYKIAALNRMDEIGVLDDEALLNAVLLK